jgi:DNA-binding PadR family transcriptional regulator
MFNSHFAGHYRHSRIFKKGDLKYIILDLIKDKPSHGYEVILTLEERFHGLYSPNAGSIYPVLQLLEDMGYVVSNQTEGRKVYTITEQGKGFLRAQEETTQKIKGRFQDWWSSDNRSAYLQDARVSLNYLRDLRRLVGDIAVHRNPAKIARVREILARAFSEIEKVHDER